MSTLETQPAAVQSNGAGDATFAVENPSTGELITRLPAMSADQVGELVERARRAQPAWEALGFAGRAEAMYEMRRWLIQNRERVLQTVIDENGKTREDAQLGDLMIPADGLGFWAKNAGNFLKDERLRPHSPLIIGRKLVMRYRPMGVVGVIGPWNVPIGNCFSDAVPALMAGNTAVLKPSEVTPLSSLLMAEGMRAVGVPEDVMLVATGGGEAGAALVDHADMIMFTGSIETGKRIMARAAETLTPVALELGGKDPMIVLEDADIERAANAAVYGGLSNGGHLCLSVERVYVEEPVYEPFVEKVVEKTRRLRQGRPGDAGSVDVGAVTFPPQAEIVERHVGDAVDKGARVLVGGRRADGPGTFFEPTVLADVNHSMACMTDETFGPTLPIMKVRDSEEAVRLANDSRYGLNSSVWTRDLEKGERIARRIEAGSTCVNDALVNYATLELPFGGVGESGIGVRHSAKGIQKFCTTHAILVTRFALKREPHWFPYSKRSTKLLERLSVLLFGRKRRR